MDPLLYHAHHSQRGEDLAYWRVLAMEYGDPILELGSGTGRILLPIAKDGHEIVGLDNDPVMIEYLRNNINPMVANRVEVVLGDFRDFDFGTQFNLIILPCNTLSTYSFEDRSKVFRSVKKHLTYNGLFSFSIPNPLLLSELPDYGPMEIEDTFTHPALLTPVTVMSSWRKTDNDITFEWDYSYKLPNGKITHHPHSTTHLLDPPKLYIAELRGAGLEPVAAFGDFSGSMSTRDSAYLVVHCRGIEGENQG